MNSPALRANGIQFGANDATVYVTAYGAKGDGTTDDTTAIQNAINAVNTTHAGTTQGGTVYFPAGNYKVTSPLNLSGAHNVLLIGAGGLGQGFGGGGATTPASTIIYTGTGSTSFLQLNSAFGCIIRGLAILYSSASFTGILIDYGHTGAGADATYNIIDECLLGASQAGAWNAKALVSWNNADFNVLKNSHLQGAMAGVRFRETLNDYANANRVEDCAFRDFQTGHIMNAANNEVVINNLFEVNVHQGPPTFAPAYTTDITSEGATVDTWNIGLVFMNNSVEDYTAGQTEFDTSPTSAVNAYGLVFENNQIADVHFANLKGAKIKGNQFGNAVTFDVAGTYAGVEIGPNVWGTAVNYVNLPASAFVHGNARTSASSSSNDQLNLLGPAYVQHIGGNGSAPGFALSGAAQLGTGPAVASSGGGDSWGTVQITTGTTPSAFVADTFVSIATVTDNVAWPSGPSTGILFPANTAAAIEMSKGIVFYASVPNGTSSQWFIRAVNHAGGATLAASTALQFSYVRAK